MNPISLSAIRHRHGSVRSHRRRGALDRSAYPSASADGHPWYDPHYAIPLAGIILGSVLNSASLALDSFLGSVRRDRPGIEWLALGERYRTAIAPIVCEAVRSGLLPIINQMSAAGIVTLSGIMTGRILAGLDPMEAVKYAILLMFLLSGGSGLAALAASYLAAWFLTDDRQRLALIG
ncbi:MAG: transporter permease [Tardiphaga sp.]|uniref:ABC transporter permease n=1 Tax=Tardiphaga sp. TaxID=1926292 RepID=UPI00262AD04D|nr:ABC transporter permease [Tardiphaga sp.]MDB5500828.1 transporter permease [Tardiphaga sp.]